MVAVTLTWYGIILSSHPALTDFFLHRELTQRITGQLSGRAGPVYYYVPLSLLFWLPWWPLAAVAVARQWKSLQASRWREYVSPGLCISVTGFCIFSMIGSKHAPYLLPMAPWVALEFARWIGRDGLLRRSAVVFSVAAVAAAVYLVGVSLVPARESKMGEHSSLRDVAAALRAVHANGVYADHFWPSLTVYCGEKVYFTDTAPEETYEKADAPSEHFGYVQPPHQKGEWFVHFRKSTDRPLEQWLDDPRVPKTQIGDFVIGPMTPAAPSVGLLTRAHGQNAPSAN
jgi:hypothetical protein